MPSDRERKAAATGGRTQLTIELQGGVFLGLFLAGLAGSLHCLVMCGPILLVIDRLRWRGADGSREKNSRGRALGRALGYHAGRIWTYGLLGLLAGAIGDRLEIGATMLGWQRPFAFLAGSLVLAAGLAAFGWLPKLALGKLTLGKLSLDLPASCAAAIGRYPWLNALARGRQPLLLGAVMGLIPCGLVYAVLIVAATLPNPWQSALAMIVFGAGTVPALAVLIVGSRTVPRWLVAKSPSVAAATLTAAGLVILVRTLLAGP